MEGSLAASPHAWPQAASTSARGIDAWLVPVGLVAVLGSYLLTPPSSPFAWWVHVWWAPVLLAVLRTRDRRARAHVLFVVAGLVALSCSRVGWMVHGGFALLLAGVALGPWLRRREHPVWMLLLLVALALPRPLVHLDAQDRFWFRCLGLRPGMSVVEVVQRFQGYWIQEPGTPDGCRRIPLDGLEGRASEFLEPWDATRSTLSLYALGPEECTADVCFAYFEDDRLVETWLSPD